MEVWIHGDIKNGFLALISGLRSGAMLADTGLSSKSQSTRRLSVTHIFVARDREFVLSPKTVFGTQSIVTLDSFHQRD